MFQVLVVTLLVLVALVQAVPLTIKVAANDRQCLFAEVEQQESKVGFYFAVQAGGAFDIDVSILSPSGRVLYSEPKEKQGEFSFAASDVGEYQFCFSNDMSTFAEKSIEFEIIVDSNNLKAELPPNIGEKDTNKVETSILSIESRASNLLRTLQYYKTRNNRNESTVKSTESRIFWFSFFELLLMVGMAGLHVVIVQLFFTGCKFFFLLYHDLFLIFLTFVFSSQKPGLRITNPKNNILRPSSSLFFPLFICIYRASFVFN